MLHSNDEKTEIPKWSSLSQGCAFAMPLIMCPRVSTLCASEICWGRGVGVKAKNLNSEDCELILIDKKTRTELEQEWKIDRVGRLQGRGQNLYQEPGMDLLLFLRSSVSETLVEDPLCKSYTGMSLFLFSVTTVSRRVKVLSQMGNMSLQRDKYDETACLEKSKKINAHKSCVKITLLAKSSTLITLLSTVFSV